MPETVIFGGKRTFTFTMVAAVIDGKGRTIGTDTFAITSDWMIKLPATASKEARFFKITVKDYIPPLNVKIVSVNCIAAETTNAVGYMWVLTQAEHYTLPVQAAKRKQ